VARLEEVARAYGEAAGVHSLVPAASTAGTSMRRLSSP
jgi:hypothetical protein